MKLKKIASLALAGLMAVSMLAGCSGKGSDNGGNGAVVVNPGVASVVSAANDGQSTTNDVKITFKSNASLEKALKDAVAMYGDSALTAAQNGNLKNAVLNLTGIKEYDKTPGNGFANGFFTKHRDAEADKNNATSNLDGLVCTQVYVGVLPVLTEEAALNYVADQVDSVVAGLDKTTYNKDNTTAGKKYYDYSYTGEISMISVESSAGATVYFVAGSISQTVTQKTWEK